MIRVKGYGSNYTQPIIDQLIYNIDNMSPLIEDIDGMDPGVGFDRSVMADIARWAKKESKNMIFLYGSLDPYTAAAYDVGACARRRDVHKFTVDGGTHNVDLCDLPAPQRTRAMRILKRWTAVDPQCTSKEEFKFRGMPTMMQKASSRAHPSGRHKKTGW